jgi:NADPH:quinone reductase-like Zn-dependent oxidoreductase
MSPARACRAPITDAQVEEVVVRTLEEVPEGPRTGPSGNRGAFAEYARAEADMVVPKPVSLTFGQAAAVPMAGTTALRGIRGCGYGAGRAPGARQRAAGGVGTYAVQIAAALGAEVTGVCSTRNAGH